MFNPISCQNFPRSSAASFRQQSTCTQAVQRIDFNYSVRRAAVPRRVAVYIGETEVYNEVRPEEFGRVDVVRSARVDRPVDGRGVSLMGGGGWRAGDGSCAIE